MRGCIFDIPGDIDLVCVCVSMSSTATFYKEGEGLLSIVKMLV
jgi:hypothetical protein